MFRLLAPLVLLVLCSPVAWCADVIRLGPGFQEAHETLQEAIDAASDGDVLIVDTGSYAPFAVVGKSLSIVAREGSLVQISGSSQIRAVPAGGMVVLCGLAITGSNDVTASVPTAALEIRASLGLVALQDCTLQGASCGSSYWSGVALRVIASARVALLDGGYRGGSGCLSGPSGASPGGDALTASGSSIVIHGADVRGGGGASEDDIVVFNPTPGGRGCVLASSELVAVGAMILGGSGGDSDSFLDPGTSGGDGLFLDAASVAHLLDDTVLGGAAGWPSTENGESINGLGSAILYSGDARSFTGPRIRSETDPLPVVVHGAGGDVVWAPNSLSSGWMLAPNLEGRWLIPFPAKMSTTPIATLPPGGVIGATLPGRDLFSAVGARWVVHQLLVRGTSGGTWLGQARLTLLLDRQALPDCTGNQVFDVLDVLLNGEPDCNRDLVPDVCQPADCNQNGIFDGCDISSGFSLDQNHNGIPDECEPTGTWWVDDSAAPSGDGSFAAPFQTLAEGVQSAISGDTVVVRDGTYVGPQNRNLDFGGKRLVLRSEAGSGNCIIDLQSSGRALWLHSNEPVGTRLEGFTVRNGFAAIPTPEGAGVRIEGAALEVRDCVFESCVNQSLGINEGGAAIFVDSGEVTVDGCAFRDNDATSGPGGAISAREAFPTAVRIRDCLFERNRAEVGGAISILSGMRFVSHCTFFDNEANSTGGAIYAAQYSSPGQHAIVDCLFAGNSAAGRGGAIRALATTQPARINGCTFTQNSSAAGGGALALEPAIVTNCVLWGDQAPVGQEILVSNTGTSMAAVQVSYCVVQGGQGGVFLDPVSFIVWGAGNVASDPLFVDPDGMDGDPDTFADNAYRLQDGSPAIDAADNLSAPADATDIDGDGDTTEPVPLDLRGKPRFMDLPGAPDVGNGPPPLMDMGAFERQS